MSTPKQVLSNGLTRQQAIEALKNKYTQKIHDFSAYPGKHYIDIPYGTKSSRQCIDIYVPEGQGPFPALVEVHGGAWYTGDRKDRGLTLDMSFLTKGYAVVSVGYRLVDEAAMPEPLEDVEAALDYLLAHGREYNLDTARMCGTGGSAGTTLILAAALRKKCFKAMLMTANILNFETLTSQLQELGLKRTEIFDYPEQDYSIEGLLLGGGVNEKPEMWNMLNGVNYLDKDAPKMLLVHGINDNITPYFQTVDFVDAVNRITGDPGRAAYMLLPHTKHSNGRYDAPEVLYAMEKFLQEALMKSK